MPLGAYDRRCKSRNLAWLKRILRCHSRGCDKKEVIDTKKAKAELKTMANEISAQYGFFLNVTEVGKVLGVSRETARKLVSNLSCAEIGNTNKYYIYDVLEFVYK